MTPHCSTPSLATLGIVCVLAALPGCWPVAPPTGEPPARPSLLLLDFGLAAPRLHDDTLRLFSRAGYDAAARPSYPALTMEDVRRYDAIMLLAGPTPTQPGAMLTSAALAPLADFVQSGGVLLLGALANPAGDDAGENERTLYNALLRRSGIPIVIHKGWVRGERDVYANTLYDAPWLYPDRRHPLTDGLPERLALPRAVALDIAAGAATLVTTSPGAGSRAVVAMGRSGQGLVVVASRQFFNPTGAYQVDTPLLHDPALRAARHQLMERLAGYTIDWIHRRAVWTANGSGALDERAPTAAPSFWRSTPLAGRPPAGAGLYTGDVDAPSVGARAPWLRTLSGRYRWIMDDGIRAGWVYVDRDAPFQRAVRDALVAARLNVLWGAADAELISGGGDEARQRLLAQWTRMDRLLPSTGIKWFMGSHYPGAHASLADYPPALGAQGQTIGGMSPLDRRFWESEIFPVLRAEADFSRRHPSVAGVIVDLEMYQLDLWYFTNGFDFGDQVFELYLRELEQHGELEPLRRARALEAAGRFAWLMEEGRLEAYYAVLEREAEQIGRALRERIHAVNPDLVIGVYAAAVPTGWFYDGLLRGAGDRDHPVVLFTFQHAPDRELEAGHTRGIYLLHAGAVLLGQVTAAGAREALHARLAREQGYWLNNIATLASDDPAVHRRSAIESPREGRAADYLTAIADANKSYGNEHNVIGDGGRQGEREHRPP